ncbi:MAG: PAS domain S-box protein [Myxococcales bacterium]|nr:PAS domain S-box protein [Myxococcales bacterium]MCB9754492.1 PAS domain S-box protein [Myxococcales bacterium]
MGDDGERGEDDVSSRALAEELRALAEGGAPGREREVLGSAAARLEALRDERDRLRATIDRALIGIFRTSLTDGRILYSNHRNAALLGYESPADSIANMRASANAYVDPAQRDEMRRRITRDGYVDQFRAAVYCKDGSVKHVVFSARLYPEHGFLEGTMADDTDRVTRERELEAARAELERHSRSLERAVAERTRELSETIRTLREAQRQLVEAEKMAALGGLVAGVAHEINTPVGIGVTAASALAERTRELLATYRGGGLKRSALERYLAVAEEASTIILANLRRAGELVESFKQVAVDQSAEKQRRFNLKPYLESLLVSLRPQLRRAQHRVELHGDDELAVVNYPGALAQVVTNLLMNSLQHAYGEGDRGQITIDCRADDELAWVDYRDDGRGVPNEIAPKIFEPFFTTRRGHGGSGLGLSIAYNLVTQQLGGTIRCERPEGGGARFLFSLARRRVADATC